MHASPIYKIKKAISTKLKGYFVYKTKGLILRISTEGTEKTRIKIFDKNEK